MLFIYKYLPLIFRYPPLFVHMFKCSYVHLFISNALLRVERLRGEAVK